MSTGRRDYILIGVDISQFENEIYLNKYEEYLSNTEKGELTILVDVNNTDYILFGEIVECGDEFEGLPFTELSLEEYNQTIERVKEKVEELFDVEDKPKLYVLSTN